MAADTVEVVVKLSGLGAVQAGMRQVRTAVTAPLEAAVGRVRNLALGLGSTLLAGFSLHRIGSELNQALGDMDRVDAAAQKLGIVTSELTALEHAAQLADATVEELHGGLKFLARSAESNSEAFATLGIQVHDATGKFRSSTELLAEIADRFAAMPDGVGKTALALELFGRQGLTLIPMLNAGSEGIRQMKEEARSLGLVVGGEVAAGASTFNDNLNRPVFTWEVDWSSRPVQRLDYGLQEVGHGLKEELLWSDQAHVARGWSAEVPLDTGAAIAEFDAWTATLRGRLTGFWLPAPEQAFTVVAGVSPTQFDIEAAGLAETFADGAEIHLWFSKPDGTGVGAKVTDVADLGNGLERVTVTPALGFTTEAEAIVRPLLYVRLAEDTERARFVAENRQVRSLKVVELPLEYAALETGQVPVYLYRFWIDTVPITEWRFTSFPWDLRIYQQDWTAKRITHGQIQRSTRADLPEFTIECERDSDIPVVHLVPPALALPLHVEIRQTESLADHGTVIAIGRVQSVRAAGRSLVARCSTFTEVLPRAVPGFLLQARCNWQVFSAHCGADQTGFEKQAEITAVSGRSVVVSASELADLPAGWFAEGWIEVGTGLNRELRTILASSVPSGETITLTLSYPFHRAQTGNTALLLPGCDGKADTCTGKFDNFVNWGGHRSIARNLTLTGVRTPEPSTGKK